jgi:shikimate kinase
VVSLDSELVRRSGDSIRRSSRRTAGRGYRDREVALVAEFAAVTARPRQRGGVVERRENFAPCAAGFGDWHRAAPATIVRRIAADTERPR